MEIPRKEHYAGFWPRLLAHNIDLLPILGFFYLSTLLPTDGFGIFVLGGLYVGYHSLFEMSRWQASPGKRWAKIKVAGRTTDKASPMRIVLRNTLKIVSLVLVFAGFIMIIFNVRRQALHDYISGTLVLFEED